MGTLDFPQRGARNPGAGLKGACRCTGRNPPDPPKGGVCCLKRQENGSQGIQVHMLREVNREHALPWAAQPALAHPSTDPLPRSSVQVEPTCYVHSAPARPGIQTSFRLAAARTAVRSPICCTY